MAHKWYAIQVYSGSEKAVKKAIENLAEEENLKDRIKEVVVPTEDVIEVKNGKKKITERSIYPGYVFANMDLDIDLWQKIQSLPKVSRFIGESKKPTPISEADVRKIMEKAEKKGAPKPKISYEPGEMVRITEGPFANFTGVVEEYDMEHGKLKLNVSIFGRSTPVEILYTQVEKII
ncbi:MULTISPECIES: transcription termination/antitermination protein NusG [unclassified Nitratiruptor]|uniref:transcription termination/antitermination protein NusG n=1 Tax=unclassified Nitratiruptor TaxID=2624044 RepID=UPI001915AC0F|nr:MULTISPECIES: transcription termination/antitermination protein NusG [unclassified Nitratiruptor]BCD59531.1 transcription termination/antitermination protein NusG [Nitratiruptor sp. YY08-10]BCD63455.1 transcription termination/antitermination protein NusG [Nitratiruptor sp. YY08-14]